MSSGYQWETPQPLLRDNYDYVMVGGGPAGCRLQKDGGEVQLVTTVEGLVDSVRGDVTQSGSITLVSTPEQAQAIQQECTSSKDTTFMVPDAEGNPVQRITLSNTSVAPVGKSAMAGDNVTLVFDNISIETIG